MLLKKISLPLHQYPAGSNGPEAANRLLREDGFKWWLDDGHLDDENSVELVNELVAK